MRHVGHGAGRIALALLCGLVLAGSGRGQEDSFVGRPGQAGGFESFDPVLTDEVMTANDVANELSPLRARMRPRKLTSL